MIDIIDAANYIKSIDATQIEKTQAICGLVSVKFTDGLKRFMLPHELEVVNV